MWMVYRRQTNKSINKHHQRFLKLSYDDNLKVCLQKISHHLKPSSKYTLFTSWNFQSCPRFDWQRNFKTCMDKRCYKLQSPLASWRKFPSGNSTLNLLRCSGVVKWNSLPVSLKNIKSLQKMENNELYMWPL